MTKERRDEVCSNGGRRAWELGRAHRFTPEEAQEAGRKGGTISRRPAHTYQKRVPEGEQLV